MFKIRRIKFKKHPILQDLELNFCNKDGSVADTILFAGENGCGKSTIIDTLYSFFNIPPANTPRSEAEIELEKDGSTIKLSFYKRDNSMFVDDGRSLKGTSVYFKQYRDTYPFKAIYSDIDINFHSQPIHNVTSMALDTSGLSRRSDSNLSTQIKQLLIDIQNLDDSNLAKSYRLAKKKGDPTDDISVDDRISRFTRAFNTMFDQLNYEGIDNIKGGKHILFKKYEKNISIDDLSSGEKQIVYRGSFLLKDLNALNGAFVFIDEPEISLHPKWQMKIMEYYKGIFTNSHGIQTSQIFAVTHSPFVIHNENRRNDKVLVIKRDDQGKIVVVDNPKYYKCFSEEAVEDAFNITNFLSNIPTVYLEGRTDKKYFDKTLEVFGIDTNIQFQWIGYLNQQQQEVNTGKDSLKKAFHFLVSQHLPIKNMCLFDSDTKKDLESKENVLVETIPVYNNQKNIQRGIENALVLDDIDLEDFRNYKKEDDGYGAIRIIPEFQKMKLCDYICTLDVEKQKKILKNLESVINNVIKKLEE